MRNLIENVKRNSPREIEGYIYLKTQKVYVPYQNITIECLTRKISELYLFFESVLKLIEIPVKDIQDIARILGVSYDILKEVIIDLANMNYIFVSANSLGITEKGKEALKSKKRVDIIKTYLKDVCIDMITGNIFNADDIILTEPTKYDVCLDNLFEVDNDYLDRHFQDINDFYKTKQKNDNVFGNQSITKELYKIVGISYSSLLYLENKVHIYKSETSEEIKMVFASDYNDQYKDEFYNCLKSNDKPCIQNFFENSRDLVKKLVENASSFDSDLIKQTNETRNIIFSDTELLENKIESFTKERYALNDLEYMSYLYNSKSIKYDKIIICSNHITGLLSPSLCSQLNALATNIPVFIVFDKNEYNSAGAIAHFFKSQNKNLIIVSNDSVDENLICFEGALTIEIQENIVTAFESHILYKLFVCNFEYSKSKEIAEQLLNKYDLNKYIINATKKHSKKRKR